jgi:hypothetical protein
MSGFTDCPTSTLIATSGAHQPNYGGGSNFTGDGMLVKFDSTGVRLWGTYYGGNSDDEANSCTTDSIGNIYISGYTMTKTASVIATAGTYKTTFFGSDSYYLAKFTPSGTRLWGTYYGISVSSFYAPSCAADRFGNVYLTGVTFSSTSPEFTTTGAHQTNHGGGSPFNSLDGFLAKIDGTTGQRIWGTYYGGTLTDIVSSCATDKSGNVFIAGATENTTSIVIATAASHQSALATAGVGSDGFLVKFNPAGVRQWGTYYGGIRSDGISQCICDTAGNVFVCGGAASDGTVIATPGSHQPLKGSSVASNQDAFLVKFTSAGVRDWGTFYGGTGSDGGASCVPDKTGNIYLVGTTESSVGIATTGAHKTLYTAPYANGFIARFFDCSSAWAPVNLTPAGNSTVCSSRPATLTASAMDMVTWHTNATSTSTVGTGYIFETPPLTAGTHTYYAATNACPSAARIAITVTVLPSPVVTVNSGTICPGGSFTIAPSGAQTYSVAGGFYVVTPQTTTSFTLVGKGVNGCISSNTATSTVYIDIIPNISVNSGSICAGKSFTIIPTGANTYTVSGGNFVVSPLSSTSYSVTGFSAAGCASGNTVSSSVFVHTVFPNVVVPPGGICKGASFTLTPSGADTYTYLPSGPVVTPQVNTSYTVTGTNLQTTCSKSVAVTVSVFPIPQLAVQPLSMICAGETITLTATGAVSYTWDGGAGSHEFIGSPAATTTYTLEGTDNNGCRGTLQFVQQVDECVSLDEQNDTTPLIFPNPTTGTIYLNIKTGLHLVVMNLAGQIVLSKPVNSGSGIIDLHCLSPGLYIVKAETEGKTYVFKLVKE